MKIDGFIRIYDGTRYLVLFGKYGATYNRIIYLISQKFQCYVKIKVDS